MSSEYRDGDVVIAYFAGEDRTGIIIECDGVPYVFFPWCDMACLIDNVTEIIGNVKNNPSLLKLVV